MEKKLLTLLGKERILPELSASSKKEALEELAAALDPAYTKETVQEICTVLKERESLGSTGIGEGIAIPHGKIKNLDTIEICFGRSLKGVPFDAVDGKPVHLFFLMLAPENAAGPYLKTLARLSRFLKKEKNRAHLLNAPGVDEIASVLARAE
jgi:PTS system nitrogen regulatory IIA component